MGRTTSSRRWLERQQRDPYVRQARSQGQRSRAAFKLAEIDARDHLLRLGATVVDLGAAPGGWSQYAAQRVGAQGRVVALDTLPMDPLPGVHFIRGDFSEDAVIEAALEALGGTRASLVMSDMAPNITGNAAVDLARAYDLAELALDFARRVLAPDGSLLVKVFQGAGFEEYRSELRNAFRQVVVRKPKASRPRSREVYLLAREPFG